MGRFILAIIVLLLLAPDALAWGEVFRANVSAIGHCGGVPALRAGTRETAPLWLRLDGADSWTLSLTPDFDGGSTARLHIDEFIGAERSGNVHIKGSVKFTDAGGVIAFDGLLFFDRRLGGWRKFRGYFNQTDVFGQGCRWAGRLTTRRRLN